MSEAELPELLPLTMPPIDPPWRDHLAWLVQERISMQVRLPYEAIGRIISS